MVHIANRKDVFAAHIFYIAAAFSGVVCLWLQENIVREISSKKNDYREILKVDRLEAPNEKLPGSTVSGKRTIRFGLVGYRARDSHKNIT